MCHIRWDNSLFVSTNNTNYDIVNVISRLGLVFLIETIAFFFLRVYRIIIDEITVFTNERTNILLKSIALETILEIGDGNDFTGDKEVVNNIIQNFLSEDRNISNNLSQIKLKNLENDQKSYKSISDKLNQILDSLNVNK